MFKWAGWKPLLANDIDPNFLKTYSNNIHPNVIVGSITDDEIFSSLVENAKNLKSSYHNKPFWVLGGPPCQGFSTAGNRRTMKDKRNLLFVNYTEFIQELEPDGFVFENVAGLLSMDKGKVFDRIKSEFKTVMPNLTGWVLQSQNYAIPQRRKRVILVGSSSNTKMMPPTHRTCLDPEKDLIEPLKPCISVEEAISDLPMISQGEDGSFLSYKNEPCTNYQKLMRGFMSPKEYLEYYQ